MPYIVIIEAHKRYEGVRRVGLKRLATRKGSLLTSAVVKSISKLPESQKYQSCVEQEAFVIRLIYAHAL